MDRSFTRDMPAYMAAIMNGTWTDDGTLPPNWEELIDKETGRQYYVDHDTETTSWVDPRDVFFKPFDFEECMGEEFAFGWEGANDASCGDFYVDHRTWSTTLHDPRHRNQFGSPRGASHTSQQKLARAEADLITMQEALNRAQPLSERSIQVQSRITNHLRKIRQLEEEAEAERLSEEHGRQAASKVRFISCTCDAIDCLTFNIDTILGVLWLKDLIADQESFELAEATKKIRQLVQSHITPSISLKKIKVTPRSHGFDATQWFRSANLYQSHTSVTCSAIVMFYRYVTKHR